MAIINIFKVLHELHEDIIHDIPCFFNLDRSFPDLLLPPSLPESIEDTEKKLHDEAQKEFKENYNPNHWEELRKLYSQNKDFCPSLSLAHKFEHELINIQNALLDAARYGMPYLTFEALSPSTKTSKHILAYQSFSDIYDIPITYLRKTNGKLKECSSSLCEYVRFEIK